MITIGVLSKSEQENQLLTSENSLRLRIIPNSNSQEDYQIKLLIKELLGNAIPKLLVNARNLDDTKEIIEANLDHIDQMIGEVLQPLNKSHQISYGLNYFPSKVFRDITYNSGKYDSLVITIGEGAGDNWWCILFPPLCRLEKNTEIEDVEYQFFISRIINKFK